MPASQATNNTWTLEPDFRPGTFEVAYLHDGKMITLTHTLATQEKAAKFLNLVFWASVHGVELRIRAIKK